MKIIIVFKNGFSLAVTCEKFSIDKNGLGNITGYSIKGIKDRKPLYIEFEDVICIYRDVEAEDEA